MWPFSRQKKNEPIKLERKYYYAPSVTRGMFLGESKESGLTARQAMHFYTSVAPVATAVDMITREAASIPPVIIEQDGDSQQIINEASILDKLKAPNADSSGAEFYEALQRYYLITGEAFMIATGDVEREPAEIFVIASEWVTESEPQGNGMVKKFQVTLQQGRTMTFSRDDETDRFYNANKTAELWQIKAFNPYQTGRGFSMLNTIKPEAELYEATSLHNLSMLAKGMRPSAAIVAPDTLSDDQFENLRSQMDNFYSGAANAGNGLLLEGGVDIKELSLTSKDMDFANLRDEVAKAIFKRYSVPLPLVQSDTMSFNNFATAQLSFYDSAVIPLSKLINKELTMFLGERYGLENNQVLSIDVASIEVLKTRTFEDAKTLQSIGVNSDNEIRSTLGYEAYVGGDDIYKPATLIPVGVDSHTDDNEKPPVSQEEAEESSNVLQEDESIESSADVQIDRKQFINILQQSVDIKGNRNYSDEEIQKLADEQGLI